MEKFRKFERVIFDTIVKFEFDDCRYECELIDISLKGALIANCTGATGTIGTNCKLKISISEDVQEMIVMQGYIAHKEGNHVGIKCNEIDLDSFIHLRKLIELNSLDPAHLEKEIESLWDDS